jgi:integrase/recombinase XerD
MPYFVARPSTKSTTNVRQDAIRSAKAPDMERSIFDARGRRKYLVPNERAEFLRAAIQAGGEIATFCAVLTYCGPRISEVLALTSERIDHGAGTINFKTLKQRTKGATRAIPVPTRLFPFLDNVHGYRAASLDERTAQQRLWPWSRTTAWRRVKEVMQCTSIPPYLRTPRALRHGFATGARMQKIELDLIQELLGHTDIRNTAIYTKVVTDEKRLIVKRTWRRLPELPQRPCNSAV